MIEIGHILSVLWRFRWTEPEKDIMLSPKTIFLTLLLAVGTVFVAQAAQARLTLDDHSSLMVDELKMDGASLSANFHNVSMTFPLEKVTRIFLYEYHVLRLKDGRRFALKSVEGNQGWLSPQIGAFAREEIQSLEMNPTYLALFDLDPEKLAASREFGPVYEARLLANEEEDTVEEVAEETVSETHSMPVVAVQRMRAMRDRFLASWDGRVDLSFQSWDGNKSLREADLAMKAEMNTGNSRLSLDGIGSYDKPENGTADDSGFFRAKWDFNQVDNRYNFYLMRLGFSEFDDVPNSQVLGYGIGWVHKRSPKDLFRFSIGLTGTRENRTPKQITELSSVFSVEYKKPLAQSLGLESDFNFYPSLEDFSNSLLADGTISLFIPISHAVDWKLSLFGRYSEDVKPGQENLDTRFASSVSYKF